MAGTDNTRCSSCGEGWYDKTDRVGTLCPDCWYIDQLEQAAAEAQRAADDAREQAVARREERRRDHEGNDTDARDDVKSQRGRVAVPA